MMSAPNDPLHQDPTIPPGWDYDPSRWGERLPIVGLALVGFCIAMYLSLYQWHVIEHVFEPFFGGGSELVLRGSAVAHLSERYLHVPDAFLGAAAYAAEVVLDLMGGGRGRWRTAPRTCLLFGAVAFATAAAGIALTLAQPLVAHAWCTLCLASAAVSVAIACLAMREVRAALQHLASRRPRRADLTPGHAS